MLLQHAHDQPVGTVVFDTPTTKGVTFTAHIPKIDEPGILQDRTNEAWQSVRSKILRHVSIGFRPTKPPVFNEDGGYDYPAVELVRTFALQRAMPARRRDSSRCAELRAAWFR